MRYFITLAYHGARFNGWQIQPNAPSVQETLETACSTILRQPIGITGCGRTDTGVHARYYVAHFDAEGDLPDRFLLALNGILPAGIGVYSVRAMPPEAHARYDAYERSYKYYISLRKNPFATESAWFYPQNRLLDLGKMQEVADVLPKYRDFFPFCKTHSGVDSYTCELRSAHWELLPDEHLLVFHITANRFLRGMVRLIVGACVQAGMGQITVQDVQKALDEQKSLKKSLSVPPQGLFLTDVKYPYPVF
ncbi:MAG: tRNA pseudouridine(38-40) synthase TruA [Saprospiraceae bacterium]|nr:tRNA pseudouridine(38-40) synthase TruA [Saprospiraceae bacterium]